MQALQELEELEAQGPREALVKSGVVVALALVIWWLFAVVGHRAVRRMSRGEGIRADERRQRVETLWKVIRRVGAIVVLAVTALMLMSVWGISTVPLLAIGSAVGLAVGFGAQNFVKDLIAGFFILLESQYAIGDVVRVAGIAGRVEDIQLRVTVLRDLDGNRHYIPNGEITVTSNLTQEYAQVVADIGVAYKEEVDRVIDVLRDESLAFSRDPQWAGSFLEEPQILGVEALGDSAVVIRVLFKVLPMSRWEVRREFLRRAKNRLDREGIEIPFPHRTLYLGGSEWGSALGSGPEPGPPAPGDA